jgi:RimJ/RimL family protein N-acetyltransferase
MHKFTLRAFQEADGKHLLKWYENDVAGLQSLFGPQTKLSADFECMAAFNDLFEAVRRGYALFWMIDKDTAPLGFFTLTHIPADRSSAMAHIYIDAAQRRYSLYAAKAIDKTLADTLAGAGMSRIFASIGGGPGAVHLAKRLGFTVPETVLMAKTLTVNGG